MGAFSENYNVSETPTKYMKFQDGDNTFRVLSEPITGWEYWTKEHVEKDGKLVLVRHPHRVKTWDELPDERKSAEVWGTELAPKEFQAFKVFNRANEQVQVLEITQKTLMKGIVKYDRLKAWGDIRAYDLNVYREKTGSGPMDVEYTLQPLPKEPLDEGVKAFCDSIKVNLTAFFRDEDPFDTSKQVGDEMVESYEKSQEKGSDDNQPPFEK